MRMYMNVLDEALNGSEERDQAFKEKFMEEAYAPENNEAGWLSKQGVRLLNTVGTGFVALRRLQQSRTDFQVERADSYAQKTG